MERILFVKQSLRLPKVTGAVLPSSRHLAAGMLEKVDFEKASNIVEFGPGTGVFTELLLERRQPQTKLLLVECNPCFADNLKKQFQHEKNLEIVCASAEQIQELLRERGIHKVDYIISGLPFASLPKELTERILTQSCSVLGSAGIFVTFQYTRFKLRTFQKYFSQITSRWVLRNFPPAYVFTCRGDDIMKENTVDRM